MTESQLKTKEELSAMYEVLKPIYFSTGQFITGINRRGDTVKLEYQRVEWEVIGKAAGMEHAKELFGGAPVLGAKVK